MSLRTLLRVLGAIILGLICWQLGLSSGVISSRPVLLAVLALLGMAIGFAFTPLFLFSAYQWLQGRLRWVPVQRLMVGTGGLLTGLAIAALLGRGLASLPSPFGRVLPLIVAIVLAYLGAVIAIIREKDLLDLLRGRLGSREAVGEGGDACVLLDTSVIIDGRIADISRTGFIQGKLLVPRFVLDELQYIADSPDSLRRNRGRRGLDMLRRLQKEASVPVEIVELEAGEAQATDGKLVELAKRLGCPVVTNDYNLNRVAELQGVRALNVNELAKAVRMMVLPGESLTVQIIQAGKEPGQGVGYLDDGTMVVVGSARQLIDKTVTVVATRVLQTVGGRMIFAQLAE